MTSKALSGSAIILLGIWMMLAAQWALEATEREICWMWWTSMGLGAVIILLGAFSIIRK